MLQGRLGGLVGAPSGYVESLPAHIRRRVKGLKGLQHKHAALEAEFQNEILALEKKYLALYTPLYQKRAEYVCGKAEPTDAEVTEGVSDGEDEDDAKEADDEDEEDKDAEKAEGKNPLSHTQTFLPLTINCTTDYWCELSAVEQPIRLQGF